MADTTSKRTTEPVIGERVSVAGKTTPDGYPLPLSGFPLATQPGGVAVNGGKKYPPRAHPAQEELAPDEMRLICLGSGNPTVRRGQAATGWLVQLGNSDNFIFDIGAGTVQNLWSLGFPPAIFDKLFLSHLHLDHVGDFFALFDAMVWGRNKALNVYGPSGYTPEEGTKSFCECMVKASSWHIRSKVGIGSAEGMKVEPHEFDYSKFGPENPRQLIYDKNGVKIYAFPVVHLLEGAVGYRLEWNGRSMTFHGDGTPSEFEAEQAKGVDVFMHEAFLDAETFARVTDNPIQMAKNVTDCHTTSDRLGKLFGIAKPRLGVGYHYHQDDDTIDPFFAGVKRTYDGPVLLAQDFTVINVTPEQIVYRQAETDLLHQIPKNPDKDNTNRPPIDPNGRTPKWLEETVIHPE